MRYNPIIGNNIDSCRFILLLIEEKWNDLKMSSSSIVYVN